MKTFGLMLIITLRFDFAKGKLFTDCLSFDLHKKEKGIHIAKTINLGKTAHLPCHFCKSHKVHPMVWFRFTKTTHPDPYNPKAKIALWRAMEVELDAHTNQKMNRVYLMGTDHTLVIKALTPADAGTYFCAPYDKTNDDISEFGFEAKTGDEVSAIQVALQFDFHKRKNKFTFLIHLDVVYVAKMRVVSRGLGYPVPADATGPKEQNWMTLTSWGEWGECNICDMEGERRREGICVVKRIKKDAPSKPPYMDRVLSLFPQDEGVECASSIFSHKLDIFDRPNEIEVGACKVACNGSAEHKKGILGQFVYKISKKRREQAKRKKLERQAKDVEKYAGINLEIVCAGSSPMSAVTWWKGDTPLIGRTISKITKGRITYTPQNALLFTPIRESDSGLYYCKYGDVMSGHTKLIVRPNKLLEMRPYWIRLFFSFCGIFIIYAFILFVKYKAVLRAPKQKRTRSFFERQEKLRQARKHSSDSTSYTSGTFSSSKTFSSSSGTRSRKTYSSGSFSGTPSSMFTNYSTSSPDTNVTNNNNHNRNNNANDSDPDFAPDSNSTDPDSTDSEAAKTDFTRSSKATARFVQFSASRDAFLDTLRPSAGHYFAYLTDPESSDHTESSGDELLGAELWD